jgi:hypothetical protein
MPRQISATVKAVMSRSSSSRSAIHASSDCEAAGLVALLMMLVSSR